MLSRLNIFLAVLLVIVFALPIVTRVNYSKPNYEFLPEMKYSPAWSAYDANPNFVDGRTLQAPVPGTIARGQMPVHFAPVEKEGDTPGAELPNPYDLLFAESETDEAATDTPDSGEAGDNSQNDKGASDEEAKDAARKEQEKERQKQQAEAQEQLRASVERGGNLYRVFCICCHGAGGAGDGPVAKQGYPPPPSLLTGKSLQLQDGQLFHILTYGRASMPEFAGQLSQADRWDVINFIRSIQPETPASAPPTEETQDTPTTKEDVEPQLKTEPDSNDAPTNESTTTDSKGKDDE